MGTGGQPWRDDGAKPEPVSDPGNKPQPDKK